jgi:hypothetical protein
MRSPRSNIALTVAIGATMLIGAGMMALVLFASGAPEAVAIGVVLAAIPFGPVIGCYLWLDRYEPEPRSLLLLGLGWGTLPSRARVGATNAARLGSVHRDRSRTFPAGF